MFLSSIEAVWFERRAIPEDHSCPLASCFCVHGVSPGLCLNEKLHKIRQLVIRRKPPFTLQTQSTVEMPQYSHVMSKTKKGVSEFRKETAYIHILA